LQLALQLLRNKRKSDRHTTHATQAEPTLRFCLDCAPLAPSSFDSSVFFFSATSVADKRGSEAVLGKPASHTAPHMSNENLLNLMTDRLRRVSARP
jgi:hypothetical protein